MCNEMHLDFPLKYVLEGQEGANHQELLYFFISCGLASCIGRLQVGLESDPT